MIPRGAAALLTMRLEGKRPAGRVWINAGDFDEPTWWKWANTLDKPEILIRPEDSIDRLDLRCLVGLPVILFFEDFDARINSLYHRVTEYADDIAVLSAGFGDDIGWWHIKGHGRVEFDDRQHLEAYNDARADATHAALMNDQPAYALAMAKELHALEAAPWLR